jgi:hypothetical protein
MCDRLSLIVPVLVTEELQLGWTYWLDRDGKVERFAHRRVRVEGSWSSIVSVEVHPCAPFSETLLRIARERGGQLMYLRIDGNPAKWFQPQNVLGSPRVYDLARVFVAQVIERCGLTCAPIWSGIYLTRVDATLTFDLGDFGRASSFVRQLSRFAAVRHRRASGFDSSLVFPGRRSSLSIYHKGPELRVHPPVGMSDELLDYADRLVRFEVVSRSERLEEMQLRHLHDWRYESAALLFKCWLSFVERLRFPVISDVDLSRLSAPARRLFGVWMAGHDVRAVASQATVYRHRSAIMAAGGPDITLPKPDGDVVEFRRVLSPVPAAVPAFLVGQLYEPPLAA